MFSGFRARISKKSEDEDMLAPVKYQLKRGLTLNDLKNGKIDFEVVWFDFKRFLGETIMVSLLQGGGGGAGYLVRGKDCGAAQK